MTTTSADLLKSGDPAGALAALQGEIRTNPQDAKLRTFLFQLLCVLGQWERAHNQLDVAAQLDASALPMAQMYRAAIRCELLRAKVFAGGTAPMVFGEPEEWLALLIESLLVGGRGQARESSALRARAFEQADPTAGTLDGTPFEWLADADSRLGPVLEAIINGRYYWVPFARLTKVAIEAPQDLRDVVWTPAQLEFTNGGESVALIPTRYVGSERSVDAQILLARKTVWTEAGSDAYHGVGQRLFATEAGDTALMDVRTIALAPRACA